QGGLKLRAQRTNTSTSTEIQTKKPDIGVGAGQDVPPEEPPAPHVLWDELMGLKELVLSLRGEAVHQRLTLRNLESRLRDGEQEAREQSRSIQSLQEEAQQHREELKAGQELLAELSSTVRSCRRQLEEQSKGTGGQITVKKSAELSALQSRLNASESQVDELRRKHTDDLKVAFSAGLTDSGSVGPFDDEVTLVFSKIISNVGQAFNQSSGVFTAPLRGLYFFSFTAADYLKGYMGLYLHRNSQPILFSLNLNDHGGYATAAGGLALELQRGDTVRLSLPASYRLYDDSRNFSIFSGFLLFPL
uniref:C1q domain-containing protein n=1 Tax=Myripristis murdjan TaxID=586833 RepID=A0A667YUZ1_9TELE